MLITSILRHMTTMSPQRTADLPRNEVGIYGLVDHEGRLSYIGSTGSPAENFRKRIHQRHRTGSENHSHYFSKIYNTGRMWRDPVLHQDNADAKIAKNLRSAFIAEYCKAVWFPLETSKQEIERIEMAVIAAAPADCRRWNGNTRLRYVEPTSLVDQLIDKTGLRGQQRAALERQNTRFLNAEMMVT